MPWAAGVYTRGYASWANDASMGLPISSAKFDIEDSDFAAGLNNCLTKDGLSVPNTAMTWGLATQVLALTRSTDGAVFSTGRTGGTNNPKFSISVTDATGVQLATSFGKFVLASPIAVSGGASTFTTSSGVAVTITGIANQWSETITGSSTSGQSYGLLVNAGTTAADTTFQIRNASGANTFTQVHGDGSGYFATTAAGTVFSWTSAGNFTLAAANSGISLVVNGVTGAASYAMEVFGGTGATDLGVLIRGGSAQTNYNLICQNNSGSTALFYVYGDGSVTVGNPTGGPNGLGTINASSNIYVNNNVVATVANFPSSAVTNGYTKLANGIQINWGITAFNSGGSTYTFPVPFPTACLSAVANAYGSAATAVVTSFTRTTLSAINGINGNNSYIAIGY